jgi:hypothetical protein
MEISLKPLLVVGFQTDKFDSHAHSRITGAHQGACHDLFRPNPQFCTQAASSQCFIEGPECN